MVKISLFGLAGTGTTTVGKIVGERFKFEFIYSGDIFRKMATEKKMDLYKFSKLCEKDSTIDKELDKKIEEIGKKQDDFLIDSRLSWYFIPDSIKIKLVCDDIIRLGRISKRDNITFEQAKKKTSIREESEKIRYYSYYKIKDYTDDSHFELIIDTSNLSPMEVARKIETYIIQKLEK